jgi:anoctamin-10
MLALALPRINSQLEHVAELITEFENHRTQDNYEMSLTQKKFILSIITNYLPIFITAFIYVPFGEDIVPWLSSRSRDMLAAAGHSKGKATVGEQQQPQQPFDVDSGRLRDEVIALALTGQVSSFFEENIVPVAKRKMQMWYRDYRSSRSRDATLIYVAGDDDPAEAKFLQSARLQATLEPYNVQDDIAEIVLQFGYLALFSPVWPLISIGFLINNIVELRTDFLKITTEHQRPAPVRSDGIGPWIASLDFLTSAGSISTGAIVHLFGTNSIAGGAWWALPITIFISEHVFASLRSVVRFFLQSMGSEQIRRERQERYAARVKHLEELEANKRAGATLSVADRDRRKSIRASDSDIFFTKQIEEGMSASVAVKLIRDWRASKEEAALARSKSE